MTSEDNIFGAIGTNAVFKIVPSLSSTCRWKAMSKENRTGHKENRTGHKENRTGYKENRTGHKENRTGHKTSVQTFFSLKEHGFIT